MDRLQHGLYVVPQARLVLLQSLVSLNQLFIKLVREFGQFVLEAADLFEEFLVGELLLLDIDLNLALLFDNLFLDIFFHDRDLGDNLVTQLAKQLLHLVVVSFCVNFVSQGLKVGELRLLLHLETYLRAELLQLRISLVPQLTQLSLVGAHPGISLLYT